MNNPTHKIGFFVFAGRCHEAEFVSQHEWCDAITIRLKSGETAITTWDHFLKDKPLTERQQSIISKRELRLAAKKARQEAQEAARRDFVEKVKAQLGPEPRKLGDIAKALGLKAGNILSKLMYWDEFVGVERTEKGWTLK